MMERHLDEDTQMAPERSAGVRYLETPIQPRSWPNNERRANQTADIS